MKMATNVKYLVANGNENDQISRAAWVSPKQSGDIDSEEFSDGGDLWEWRRWCGWVARPLIFRLLSGGEVMIPIAQYRITSDRWFLHPRMYGSC